ncbi:hypothetical protein Cgig2_021344 [Carnegiea gigantea]|uniref:GOLD domain-containing protein n=1 Tax=Carnegiea gigantea TaxID=171969 RepID=A0A9Q1JYV6_9CARY|nr:hypothetical protein Cgig2_021344 [Carnegiea gigantea]
MPKFGLILIISSIVILLCSTSFEYCESLRFDLQSGSTKCISEDIKRDGMIVGKYSIINPNPYPNFNIDLKPNPRKSLVTSPRGNNYHYGDKVESGEFAFTAVDIGDYMACFWAPYHDPSLKISVEFAWKTGVDANDWNKVVHKGQIDVNGELRRLYDTANSIYDECLDALREEEMQALNKATNSKMAFFSFLSIFLCLSVAAIQLWHLKGYFERKKLL